MLYFKFKDSIHSWVLPVWEDSEAAKNPNNCFDWDLSIQFVGEVTEADYDAQFRSWKQQELF